LGKVVETIQAAGIEEIIIVTNSEIAGQIPDYRLPIAVNDSGEMLTSVQVGLRNLLSRDRAGRERDPAEAALISLGDQPQVEAGSARIVCEAFRKTKSNLVVPSYQMRRGHPWLAARPLWDEILNMREPETLREFLNRHHGEILYVECGTPTILQDVDTPGDYLKFKPGV
jgi:molybdenum cofactor cytidylyltransferase